MTSWLHCVYYPVLLTGKALLVPFLYLTAPIFHVIQHVGQALWWPVHILAKFETLYIYFSVAILVGLATGAFLHCISKFIIKALNLDVVTEKKKRTLASHRAEKAERVIKKAKPSLPQVGFHASLNSPLKNRYSEWSKQEKAFGSQGLQSTTILEEGDSSDMDA